MSVGGWLHGLQATFDTRALRPPAITPDERRRLMAQSVTVRSLSQWCLSGAAPRMRIPLAVAALRGAPNADGLALISWTDTFARHIDGGTRLDALPSGGAGLRWRLQTKLNDARPWRNRQPDDPWDAGWAISAPEMLKRLQTQWMPRRPSLVLADASDHVALRLALGALWQRRTDFRHPVRWLWVGAGAELPALPGQSVVWFNLDTVAEPG